MNPINSFPQVNPIDISKKFQKTTGFLFATLGLIFIFEFLFFDLAVPVFMNNIPLLIQQFPTVLYLRDPLFWQYFFTFLYPLFCSALPCYLLLKQLNTPISQLFPAKNISLPFLGKSLIFTLGMNFIFTLIASYFIHLLASSGITSQVPDFSMPQESPIATLLFFLSIVVVAPLVEEFVYRGVILGLLRPFGWKFALLVSASIFSLAHGNLSQVPSAFIMGLVFGYLAIKTNSLWASILVHFGNNLFATLSDQWSNSIFLSLFIYFAISFALYILWKKRKTPCVDPNQMPQVWRKFFRQPCVLVVLSMYILFFLRSFSFN